MIRLVPDVKLGVMLMWLVALKWANHAPEIIEPTERILRAANTAAVSFNFTYKDVDLLPSSGIDESHSLVAEGIPVGMTMVEGTCTDDTCPSTFTWTTPVNGAYPIKITITDIAKASDEVEFTLIVSDDGINSKPYFTSTPQQQAKIGTEYEYIVSASR